MVRHGYVARKVYGNDAGATLIFREVRDRRLRRFSEASPTIANASGNVVGSAPADKEFPHPGAGNRHDSVARIGACANYRRIADPADALVGITTGGCRSRKIAFVVNGDGADGAVLFRLAAFTLEQAGLLFLGRATSAAGAAAW